MADLKEKYKIAIGTLKIIALQSEEDEIVELAQSVVVALEADEKANRKEPGAAS